MGLLQSVPISLSWDSVKMLLYTEVFNFSAKKFLWFFPKSSLVFAHDHN